MLKLGGLCDWRVRDSEHQCCCVTFSTVENLLIGLWAGISIHSIATEDFTVNLGNKDRVVPFNIFLACLDKQQGSRVPNETLLSVLSLKIRQDFLNLNDPHGLFPFRKQAMPFVTVGTIIGNQAFHNGRCHICFKDKVETGYNLLIE